MAKVTDAEVLLVGMVVAVAEVTDRESGKYAGRKITVMTAEGGFAVVKINPEDNVSIPARLSTIAWMIRNAAYQVETNSGMSTRFVREFSQVDEEALSNALSGVAVGSSK